MGALVELLRARGERRSRRPHGDGADIALAVEGGAMRGVISAGMVGALEELGLTDAFDAVYGSSAGAINAAYFLAGQARLGTTIYYEDINNAHFISFLRAFGGRPIVNLGFLLDEVASRRKPLDVARVFAAASPLHVLATDVDTQEAVMFDGFGDAADLLAALRASATMPIVAGGPALYRGQRLLDASLSEPIPLAAAEAGGHSHVLVLRTRGGEMRARPSAFDRHFVAPRLRRLSPALAARYLDRAKPYAEMLRSIDTGRGPRGRAEVHQITVANLHVGKLDRDAARLRDAAGRARQAVLDLFTRQT